MAIVNYYLNRVSIWPDPHTHQRVFRAIFSPDQPSMNIPVTPHFVVNGIEPRAAAPSIEERVPYHTVRVDPVTVMQAVSEVEVALGHERALVEAISRRMVHEVESHIMRLFGDLPPEHRPALGPSPDDMARILTQEMLQETVRTYTWGTEAPRARDAWWMRPFRREPNPRYEPLIPDLYHRQVQRNELEDINRYTQEYMHREYLRPQAFGVAVDDAMPGQDATVRIQMTANAYLNRQREMLRPWDYAPATVDIAQIEEDRKVRLVAESKGWQLVHDILGDEDYQRFKRQGYIDIPSSKHPGTGYRIRQGKRIGVLQMPPGMSLPIEKRESLCVGAPNQWEYVSGDNVATHILMCKFNEELLLSKAIRWTFAAEPSRQPISIFQRGLNVRGLV